MSIPDLWPHQKESLKRYRQSPIIFDISDPGTGKTRAALEAFKERRDRSGGRALIIAPKSLLEPAWGEDIYKFTPELRYSVAYAENRSDAFSVPADIYIANTDAVNWLKEMPKSFWRTFDTLIVDESSNFKHRTSNRSKALKKISYQFEHKALLTGTPNSKSITDIWHQAYILDQGQRLGKAFARFRDAVCRPVAKDPRFPQYVTWEDRPNAEEAVAEILSDISIRHVFAEVMEGIPDATEHMIRFTPSDRLLELYGELRERAMLMVEQGEVNAVNAGVLRNKLLQLASGAVYGRNKKQLILDPLRTELISDLIAERKHSIIFYNWDHQRDSLVKELTKRKISHVLITRNTPNKERVQVVRDYQAGKYQALLMHPQTGAHGLTLTRGTATIWCSPTDRPDLLVQGKYRIYRGGQTEETENIMVCARYTLEKGVYGATLGQRESMQSFMRLLKHEVR